MMKYRFILVFLVLSFFGTTIVLSLNLPNQVIIDKITVNGRSLQPRQRQQIIIAQNDTIEFYYHCKTTTKNDVPFKFKINISNSKAVSNIIATELQITKYYDLPEEDYKLNISAFSSVEKWNSIPAKVKFRVNNYEAKLVKIINSLRSKINVLENAELKKASNNKSTSSIFIIFSFIIGVIFATFVLMIINKYYFKKNKLNNKEKIKTIDYGINMDTKINFTDEDFEKVVNENGNLKAELSALRGQVGALQFKTEELKTHNKKLKDLVEKLSNSKKELEELSEQKEELFIMLMHDIKNPVALIKSLVELLRSYDLTAAEQSEIIEDIFTTTNRIVSLSQDISKVLALESANLTVNFEKVNINIIVDDVINRYSRRALEKHIIVDFHRNNDLPECEVDIPKIDDVIDNLLSNAIKFSHPDSKIEIKINKNDKFLEVNVKDNGQGLSDQDIKQAFKRGAMLSARPTGNEHSSGLGLWIVKKLISLHDGKVWIKSAVGKGSIFSFSIPIKRNEE